MAENIIEEAGKKGLIEKKALVELKKKIESIPPLTSEERVRHEGQIGILKYMTERKRVTSLDIMKDLRYNESMTSYLLNELEKGRIIEKVDEFYILKKPEQVKILIEEIEKLH